MPSRQQVTKPPVVPSQTAGFGAGVTVRIAGTRSYQAIGRGPGEISGAAVAFTLEFHNGSDMAIVVGSVTVTADYGMARTPASALSGPPSAPFSGTALPGLNVAAVYCYSIPSAARGLVTLSVSYSADRPVVTIRGAVR